MWKRLMILTIALVLAAGLCPGAALAAPDLSAGSAAGLGAAPAAQGARDGALATQAAKATRATRLAKRAIKLMNALPKASKVKLAHAKRTAAAYEAAVAATRDWAAFGKVGASTQKAFLKAFNKKFVPACYALEKQIKNTTAKAKKAQVKNVKVAPGNGSATVSWKKLGSSYSYEVYYSKSKSSGYKKAESTKAAQLTVKNLDGDKTYYFKVRAYRADIPATALVGAMGKVAYGKYSSSVAATPALSLSTAAALPLVASASKQGSGSPAAAGSALGTQTVSALSQSKDVQDVLVSCRAYLNDIRGKGKKGYATGTLKGDLNKMRGVIDDLNAYADKQKADRAKKVFDTIDKANPPSDGSAETVWQAGTGLNKVAVKWGVPAIAKRDDITMLQWRISWRQLGDVKWGAPKTVAYSGSQRELTITGLLQGTSYEVRVGYRYQVGGGEGSYVTVDDWRSCTATTAMRLTFSPASFDYFYSTCRDETYLKVSVAGPKTFYNNNTAFWYEWYVNSGATFNTAAADKLYKDRDGYYLNGGENEFNSHCRDSGKIYGLKSGFAVATVGVRTAFAAPSLDSDGNTKMVVTRSDWSTKQIVADPICSNLAKYWEPYLVKGIPPLKGAKSYTVYLGRYTGSSDDFHWEGWKAKVTGWKVAGTFAANNGKVTKVVLKSYGGKRLDFGRNQYVVKIVTHTIYGSSPGEYWY